MDENERKDAPQGAPEKDNIELRKSKRGGVKKVLLIILAVIVALIVAVTTAILILRGVGASKFKSAVMKEEEVKTVKAVTYDEGKTIEYGGRTYVYNDDVIHFAFMGIDKTEFTTEAGDRSTTGQSDTNLIVAIDTESGRVSLIAVPRDSMVDVDIFNAEGENVGIAKLQLCLSYSYGDGRETSCANTLRSLARLLYGIEIDNYYALDLDGISALNDAVGGVEVTVLDDVPGFTEGEKVTLYGKDAVRYVQYRDKSVFNSDSTRRQRQIQYAKAFVAKAFSAVKNDLTFTNTIFDVASDYACTNFDISHAVYLVTELAGKRDTLTLRDEDIHVLSGEAVMGEKMEVNLDRTSVFETVLDVFYNEVDNEE